MTIQPLPSGRYGSLAPQGLTTQDQRRIQEALDSSTSANTRRAYNQAWRRFETWAASRWPWPLPAGAARAGCRLSWRSWPRRASRWPPSGSPSPPWRRSTDPLVTKIPRITRE